MGKTIDNGNYIITRFIRIGTYAHVYEAEHISSGRICAIKCLFKHGLTRSQLAVQREEAEFHRTLGDHDHIVSLEKVVETDDNLYFIMEYCEDDLYEAIIREEGFQDDEFIRWAFPQLIDAVQHCHDHGVYHNDLKPENVLIGKDFTLKLADFGLATYSRISKTFGFGTTNYMAPECFGLDNASSYRCDLADIWSLGVILINMRFGRNPWQCATDEDPLYTQYVQDPDTLQKQFFLSDEFGALLKKVLHPNPKKRCTLQEFKNLLMGCDTFVVEPDYDEKFVIRTEGYAKESAREIDIRDTRCSADSGLGESFQEKNAKLPFFFEQHCKV